MEELTERFAFASHLLDVQRATERRRSLLREAAFFLVGAVVSALLSATASQELIDRLLPW